VKTDNNIKDYRAGCSVAASPLPGVQFEQRTIMPLVGTTMRKLLFWSLLACFATLPPVLSADAVVEEIIARVNNQIVTRTVTIRLYQTAASQS